MGDSCEEVSTMVEIVDLNDCRLSRKNGMYGGAAGNKDGIEYNDENWW